MAIKAWAPFSTMIMKLLLLPGPALAASLAIGLSSITLFVCVLCIQSSHDRKWEDIKVKRQASSSSPSMI